MIRPAALLLATFALVLPGTAAAQTRDIPEATWEPIYFRSINEMSSQLGWTPLRDVAPAADLLEVRVWIGFGIGPMEVYSMRRVGKAWSARYAMHGPTPTSRKALVVRSATPKSDWNQLWGRLVELGILTLPDSSTLPKSESRVADGVSYVVEINRNGAYRTYEYGNPEYEKWPQAQRIIEIIRTLRDGVVLGPKSVYRDYRPDEFASKGRTFDEATVLETQGKGAEAVKMYMRAAREGSGKAALRLAQIYEEGIPGVSRDYALSLRWYYTARAMGEDVPQRKTP